MIRRRGVRTVAPGIFCFILAALILALPRAGFAQADGAAPGADQIEAFRNLTPEQQRAILDAVSGTSGSMGATGVSGEINPNAESQIPGVPANPSRADPGLQSAQKAGPPPVPHIKSAATVLLDVELDGKSEELADPSQ